MRLPLLPDSLARQTLHRGALVIKDEPLTISTPAQPWAYALSYTLRPPAVDTDGAVLESIRFVFDVSVAAGRIGVGWTTADGASYVSERFTSRSQGRVSFILPAGERAGRLVFRNADTTGGPSVFIVSDARVEALTDGARRYPVSISARELSEEALPPNGGTLTVFDTDAAIAINAARLSWLQEARLPIDGARVLDAGSGVGHFVPFYQAHGCTVVAIDGREDNIEELRRRHPEVDARVADAQTIDAAALGSFDVIHCFGLLYHLDSPIAALRRFEAMCRHLLILETMVCDSSQPLCILADETKAASQALDGVGSRPSPSFLTLALNRVGFSNVYGAAKPPVHPDFQFEWRNDLAISRHGTPLRCVLVASRTRLEQPSLVPLLES